MSGYRLDRAGLGQGQVAGTWDCGKETFHKMRGIS